MSTPTSNVSKWLKIFLRSDTKKAWSDKPEATSLTHAHVASHTENIHLKTWFKNIYNLHKENFNYSSGLPVLELGSGGSQLKELMPQLITSDVVTLPHIDKIIDARKIAYPDCSLSNLTMINVLHHITEALEFFKEAERVLTPGGKIIFTEPYVSLFSFPIYKYVHHELCDTKNHIFKLNEGDALLCSNQAIPTVLIFKEWKKILSVAPDLKIEKIIFHSSFCYFISGGVNFKPLVPFWLWKILNKIDSFLCRLLGRYIASFMTVVIVKKEK